MKKINTMWIKENKDHPKSKERSSDTGQRENELLNVYIFSLHLI